MFNIIKPYNLLSCIVSQVIVLEAKDRIGGRVWDDKTFKGVTVGRGAQIVNGCVNNPMALMCEQVGSLQWSCVITTEKLSLKPGSGGWGRVGFLFHDMIKTPLCCYSIFGNGWGQRRAVQSFRRHYIKKKKAAPPSEPEETPFFSGDSNVKGPQ